MLCMSKRRSGVEAIAPSSCKRMAAPTEEQNRTQFSAFAVAL